MRADCAFESEILDHLRTGTWPARADADLRAHFERCATCRDLVAVATALTDDRDGLAPDIVVPRAQLVWWRAQLRARQEASRAASRPMAISVLAAAVTAIGAVAVALTVGWDWIGGWLFAWPDRMRALVPADLGAVVAAHVRLDSLLSPVVASVATLAIIFVVLAMYVIVSEE